tara:strand:+ start:3181 stop:4275 length:1095 start_codon:yes stop_codon:yes gene_type:complete
LSVYRYPYKVPEPGIGSIGDGPTDAVDYIAIKRSRITFKKKGGKDFYGIGHASSKSSDTVHKERNSDIVYLAMPPQLTTAYQAGFSKVDVGMIGMAGLELFSESSSRSVVENIQKASAGVLSEFTAGGIANILNGLGGVLGVGGQLDLNTVQALTKGKVFNPFSEQIFRTMGFRTHTFNFKLVSRNAKEAEEIHNIIKYLKEGMAPKVEAGDAKDSLLSDIDKATTIEGRDTSNANKNVKNKEDLKTKVDDVLSRGYGKESRFFKIPDHYELKFVRAHDGRVHTLTQGGPNSTTWTDEMKGTNSMHFKIHPSFMTGLSVNYTPDGQYTSFKNIHGSMIQVPAINLSLQFVETRLINQENMRNGF